MMMKKKSFLRLALILLCCVTVALCFACQDKGTAQESPIQSIIITTLPKVNYYVGDTFALGDANLTVYYENGTSETVPLTLNMLSDFDPNLLGEQVLTVFYKNKTTYLSVNVSVAPVYSIAVCKMPDKTSYVVGEELDVTGMQILVTYSNRYTDVKDVTPEMITDFSTESEGETEMSVTYGGKFCSAAYTVVKRAPDNIEVRLSEVFRAVYVVGDEFELTGGSFFVHYNDNTSEDLDWVALFRQDKLTYAIDGETSNKFTSSAMVRSVFLFYGGNRYQIPVTVNALRPKELSVMSSPDDQVLKGSVDLTGGQLYVRYNSQQTGYTARVADATGEARRTYADGNWATGRFDYFVLNGDTYSVAPSEFSANATYYSSLEKAFESRYEQRRQFLYVKSGNTFQKAPENYAGDTIYYIPSNVRIFDFDDPVYVSIEWNEFDLNVVGEYRIRLIVEGVYVDHTLNVVAPSPAALEVYPSERNVHKDAAANAYYVYQDEVIDITDWDYKIRQNNDTYSIISSTGTYSAKVYTDMYVGSTFMSNHEVGTYVYDFSFTTATGITLTCAVPVQVRQRAITSALFNTPARTIYSVGDALALYGGNFSARYVNGSVGDVVPVTTDMLYTVSVAESADLVYTGIDSNGDVVGELPLKKADLTSFTTGVGNSAVYVYYEDAYYNTSFVARFDIIVIAKAVSIEMSAESTPKTDYVLGEAFSMENLEVLITYADQSYSTENDFSDHRWTIEGTDLSTVGNHVIVLYYGDKSDNVMLSYTCYVHNDVAAIDVENFLGYTTEGTEFDFSGLTFTAVRENGSVENVPLSSLTASVKKAGAFVAVPSEYRAATFIAEEDWQQNHTAFYTKTGEDSYLRAGSVYDGAQIYYYGADNFKTISFGYGGKTVTGFIEPTVSSLIVSRRLVSVAMLGYPQAEYTLDDAYTSWDLNDLSFELNFNNGTRAVVKHVGAGSGIGFDEAASGYAFGLNGMTYTFDLCTVDGDVYTLSELKGALGSDEYCGEELILSVSDAAYEGTVKTARIQSMIMYCFRDRVLSIHTEIGVKSGDVVETYRDPAVYLNEGLSLYSVDAEGNYSFVTDRNGKRFVYDDGSQKVEYTDSIFIVIEYDSGRVVKQLDEVVGASGFTVSGFNPFKTGAQTVVLNYLLRECTFTAIVRPNVAKSISVVDKSGAQVDSLTVIEKTNIDPNKVSAAVTLKDADGDDVDLDGDGLIDKRIVDFSDVSCTYNKNNDYTFVLKDSNDKYYYNESVTIGFQGVSVTLPLIVYKKTVSEIIMQVIPQQVYPELPEDADDSEVILKRTNSSDEMGTVFVKYDNGSTEVVRLDDGRISINSTQFNTKVVLNNGAEQSQSIYITFTDDNKVTKTTGYNVIVRDRKNVTVSYDPSNVLSYDSKFYCQYGTGSDARPLFDVYYYADFYLNTPTTLVEGNGGFSVRYEKLNSADAPLTKWPTQVGEYTMVISYPGDHANNPFEDRSIIVSVTKREIGIKVTDIELTFGQKFTGSTKKEIESLSVLGIQWEMSGVLNGQLTGPAYVWPDTQAYPDTQDTVVSVAFEITQNNMVKTVLYDDANAPSYLILNLDVGDYYLRPLISILNSNYNVTAGVGDVGAKLTILPKRINISAVNETKVYGSADPVFRFNVYDDLTGDYIGGTYYEEIAAFTVGAPITGNVYTCSNNIYTRAEGVYQSGETYYALRSLIHVDPVFDDPAVAAYRLTRSSSDTENVSDFHNIYRGVMAGALDNYELAEYTSASLRVLPAPLTVTALTTSRPYGTSDMVIEYTIDPSSSLRYNDTFDSVFGNYFSQNRVLYYETVRKRVYDQLPGGLSSYDTWATLYRNLSVSDFETVVYDNVSYVAVPFALDCGKYVFTMNDVFTDVVTNYSVVTEAFEFEIVPVEVELNVGSMILYEESAVKDDRSNGFIDYLNLSTEDFQTRNIFGRTLTYSDFVMEVNRRSLIDEKFSDWMNELILSVRYVTGNNRDYLLSSDHLGGFSFTKEEGADAGVYKVMVGYNSSNNFSSFDLYSRNLLRNKNYFSFVYDMIKSSFPQMQAMDASKYEEGVYLFVLPGFTDFKYYHADEEGARYSEVYDHVDRNTWKLSTEYTVNGVDYTNLSAVSTNSVEYSIVGKTAVQYSYLAAGNYTATLTYDYFADAMEASKFSTNYIYMGDTKLLAEEELTQILNYVFFGTIPQKKDRITFKKNFDYTVEQKVISVSFGNKDSKYNNSNQTLIVKIDNSLAVSDILNITFDVAVRYNEKNTVLQYPATNIYSFDYYSIVPESVRSTEQLGTYFEYNSVKGFIPTQDSVLNAGKTYYIATDASTKTAAAFNIRNSGDYEIRLNSIGNENYRLDTEDPVETRFTISPNELPILLFNKGAVPTDNTVDFVFRETYKADSFKPIDYNWTQTSIIKKFYLDTVVFSVDGVSVGAVNEETVMKVGASSINGTEYDVYIGFYSAYQNVTMSVESGMLVVKNGSSVLTADNAFNVDATQGYYLYLSAGSGTRQIALDTSVSPNKYYFNSVISYGSTTCRIADYYFDADGILHLSQQLDSMPNTLNIYSEDAPGSGVYPKNVKRDPRTLELLGYDIVCRDSSEFVNYAVTFVYMRDGYFTQCDEAHKFTFVIEPKTASLYQFARTATKEYDGLEASINKNVLLVNDALKTDPISVSALQFFFERLDEEGSTFVTIGGEKYYLVEKDDLASCGRFKVRAYFSDNYDIIMKGDSTLEGGKFGLYTITRGSGNNINLVFSDDGGNKLSKKYDGYGLLKKDEIDLSGVYGDIESLFTSVNIANRDRSKIYYKLEVKGYGAASDSISTASQVTFDHLTVGGNVVGYNVGYYKFDFCGVFPDKNGVYRKYDDRDDFAVDNVRWLNWNYTYTVATAGVNGYDGIYEITKRPVYIGINGQKPFDNVTTDYSYEVDYNGVLYTAANIGDVLKFYTVYLYNADKRDFVPISDTEYGKFFDQTQTLSASGSIQNVNESEKLILGINDIAIANPNFSIINGNIDMRVRPLEVEILVTFTNVEDNNASRVVYGKTVKENAVNFNISITEEQLAKFNEAVQANKSATEVLEEICNINNARFYLVNENDSTKAAFTFSVSDNYSSVYRYNNAEDSYYEDSGVFGNGAQYYTANRTSSVNKTVYYNYYEQYENSGDTTRFSGAKKYFLFTRDENIRVGQNVPAETFYEFRGGAYALTGDKYFANGKEYYRMQRISFSKVNVTVGNTVTGPYLEKDGDDLVLTSDAVFLSGKDYYLATNTGVYHVLKRFYKENEDEYFVSGKDYYVMTKASVTTGGNVRADTYYVYNGSNGRYELTDAERFAGGTDYYTYEKRLVTVGARAIVKYYRLEYSGGQNKWLRVEDADLIDGQTYYFFTPASITSDAVTKYYYYYRDGKFYNVYEQNAGAGLGAGENYYVAYVYDKEVSSAESARYAKYYSEYEKLDVAERYAAGDNYYKIVKLNDQQDVGKYNKLVMLVAGRDYRFGDSVSAYGKTVYESVSDSDSYFVTQDTTFIRAKTYYVLEPVTDLVVGDDVSGYYVVIDGYAHAEHDDYITTSEVYYKPVELRAGVDYALNTLIPDHTYYEAFDDGKRYAYSDDMYFTAGTSYYLFKAVNGYSPSVEDLDDLFTYNDGRFMMSKELVAGSDYIVTTRIEGGTVVYDYSPSFDYIIGTEVEADNTVYYRSGSRYVPVAMNEKYKKDVVYYSFTLAEGFIKNGALEEYFVDASDVYTARVMKPVEDYTIGDTVGENVVIADSFVKTTDETYKAGKLYFAFDNTGLIRGSELNNYFVRVSGYYKAKGIKGTGSLPVSEQVYEMNESIHRYVLTADTVFVSGKTYYLFTEIEDHVAESALSDLYLDGTGYYSAKEISFTPGDVVSSYGVPVYVKKNGRMVSVSGSDQFVSGTVYYELIESGFVKVSDLSLYYVDGSGYYTKTQLAANVDYTYGDAIPFNVYVMKNGRYVCPTEILFEAQKTYYKLDNVGYVLNTDLSSYCIDGSGYYTFTEIDFTPGAAVGENVYTGEVGKFTAARGAYASGKTYYLRTDEGIISVDDLSRYYFDATGYYTLRTTTENVDYVTGEEIPIGSYYEFDAQGVCRLTSDAVFVAGKTYYELFSDKTYLRADTIGNYYSVRTDKFAPICLTEGVDHRVGEAISGDVYVVSDDRMRTVTSANTYMVGKTYIVFEKRSSFISYGNIKNTYKKVTNGSGEYRAVVATGYVIGESIPSGYYTELSATDGRLIAAEGNFLYGVTYYKIETEGFVYGENENELYINNAAYYSKVGGSYVNSGFVAKKDLGSYFIATGGKIYNVSANASGNYEYYKNEQFVLTADGEKIESKDYFAMTDAGYVIADRKNLGYVQTNVTRAEHAMYEYYVCGDAVPYRYESENVDFYEDVLSGRVYERSGATGLVLTEDKTFLKGKDYYILIHESDFGVTDKVGGSYVYRKGYVPVEESFASLVEAVPGIDYRPGAAIGASEVFYVYATVDSANGVRLPVRTTEERFSATTTYYKLNKYYGMSEVPSYYEQISEDEYVLTEDIAFGDKNYYTFSVVTGRVSAGGEYYQKVGDSFVRTQDLTLDDLYERNGVNVTAGQFVVKGSYEEVDGLYVLTADERMNGAKKYYKFTLDSKLEISDPVRYFEKNSDGGYVLTDDYRIDPKKEYYYFKDSSVNAGFTYATGALMTADSTGNALSSGNYYATANNFRKNNNYNFKIVTTPFEVKKQTIDIIAMEREYFREELSFILSEDTVATAAVNSVLRSFTVQDRSNIYCNVGSYYDYMDDNQKTAYQNCFVVFDRQKIEEYNQNSANNYYIRFSKEIENLYNASPEYIYIPLFIRRATVNVTINVDDAVEYGKGEVGNGEVALVPIYNDRPDIERYAVDYPEQCAVASQYETNLHNFINNDVIRYDLIRKSIASTAYTGQGTSLSLQYNLKFDLSDINYIEDSYTGEEKDYTGLNNYWITFGEITYTIKQREIEIYIVANDNFKDSNENCFTVLYSQLNGIRYNDTPGTNAESYLEFHLDIDSFVSAGVTYSDFDKQIVEIVDGITLGGASGTTYALFDPTGRQVASGDISTLYVRYGVTTDGVMSIAEFMSKLIERDAATYGSYTYKEMHSCTYRGKNYDSITEMLLDQSSYLIYDEKGDTDTIYAGKNYIALNDSISDNLGNYKLVSKKTPIYIYPEIGSLGEYRFDGKYINMIADTDAVVDTKNSVAYVSKTSDNKVTGLNFLLRMNMTGMDADNSIVYSDVNKSFETEYDLKYYEGVDYLRKVDLYLEDGSIENLVAGRVLTLRAVVQEEFRGSFGKLEPIVSLPFKVRIRDKEVVSNNGNVTTTHTIADSGTTNLYNENKPISYNEPYANNSDELITFDLVRSDNNSAFTGNYDILTYRVRLAPGQGDNLFSTVLYDDNVNGRLEFVAKGGSEKQYYIRFTPKAENVYFAHTHTTPQSGVLYHKFKSISGEELLQVVHRSSLETTDGYYCLQGGMLFLAQGKIVEEADYYYKVSESGEGVTTFVEFSEDIISADNMADVFDGASHCITIYLDRIGFMDSIDVIERVSKNNKGFYIGNVETEFDINTSYFSAVEVSLSVGDELYAEGEALYFIKKGDIYIRPATLKAENGVTYYRMDQKVIFNVVPQALSVGTALYNGTTPLYYVIKGGLIVAPSESTALSGVDYYSVTKAPDAGSSTDYLVEFNDKTDNYYKQNDVEFDINGDYFVSTVVSLTAGDKLFKDRQPLYYISENGKYLPPKTETAVSGTTYYRLDPVDIFDVIPQTLAAGTALFDNTTPLYYIVNDKGVLVVPTETLARENVLYFRVVKKDGVGAYSDYFTYVDIASEVNKYYFNYHETIYRAVKRYFVYVSIDGDVSYSKRSTDNMIVSSFIAGLYENLNTVVEYNDGAEKGTVTVSYAGQKDVTFLADTAGKVKVECKNVQPIFSYFTLKQQLALALELDIDTTNSDPTFTAFIRNISVFPDEFNTSSSKILVTKSTSNIIRDRIEETLSSVRYFVTSGSTSHTGSMETPSITTGENGREERIGKVAFGSGTFKEPNKPLIGKTIGDVTSTGLYSITVPMRLSYTYNGTVRHVETKWQYDFLLTDAFEKTKASFRKYTFNSEGANPVGSSVYTPSASAPVSFEAADSGYYFSDEIESIDSSTIIFDVDLGSSGNSSVMFYLGTSDPKLYDLQNNMLNTYDDLWDAGGIGLKFVKYYVGSEERRATRIYGVTYDSEYTALPVGTVYQSGVEYFVKSGDNLTRLPDNYYEDGTIVNRVLYVKTGVEQGIHAFESDYSDTFTIDWERGRNILKIDYVNMPEDALISIRLYQYYFDGEKFVTDFVWQDYYRADPGTGGRDKAHTKQLVDGIKYVGFNVDQAKVKFYQYSLTTEDMRDFDLVSTTLLDADNNKFYYFNAANSSNSMRENSVVDERYAYAHDAFRSGITTDYYNTMGETYLAEGNVIKEKYSLYTLADQYNVPHAYTGNATSLTFSMNSPKDTSGNYVWIEAHPDTNVDIYGEPYYVYRTDSTSSSSPEELYADQNKQYYIQKDNGDLVLAVLAPGTPLYDLSAPLFYEYDPLENKYIKPTTPTTRSGKRYYYRQKNFIWHIADSTPYLGNYDISSRLSVRGMAISLNQNNSMNTALEFSFFKYNQEFYRQAVRVPAGMDLADGGTYTITAIIEDPYLFRLSADGTKLIDENDVEIGLNEVDKDGRPIDRVKQYLDSKFPQITDRISLEIANNLMRKGGFSLIRIYVGNPNNDEEWAETICVCPYYNDLSGLTYSDGRTPEGPDMEGTDAIVDKYFLQGVYYTGVRSAGEMTIEKYFTYSVPAGH